MAHVLGTDIRVATVDGSALKIQCCSKHVIAQLSTPEEALAAFARVVGMMEEVVGNEEDATARGLLSLRSRCLCVLWFDQLMGIEFSERQGKTRIVYKDGVSFCYDDSQETSATLREKALRMLMKK